MDNDLTPIRQQYLNIKKQYPNAILFFRLGDFYETFDHDAEITSKELDIVLTSRNVAKGIRIPMAGIPYHAVENYLAKLISKGYHVAICEQVGEQPKRGLFPREVIKVVTPGTIIDPGLLRANLNNYLVGAIISGNKCGIAYADVSTGEFAATEISGIEIVNSLRDELLRLSPSEILIPDTFELKEQLPFHITQQPSWKFEYRHCRQVLLEHFSATTLDGFGLKDKSLAVQAAGAVLQYIQETQNATIGLLTRLFTYSTDEFMVLDAATRRNLELTETIRSGQIEGSLLGVLDYTATPMGKRLLRQWVNKPLLNLEEIKHRQEAVGYFVANGILRAQIFSSLQGIGDLERLINRVISGYATPRDLVSIRTILTNLKPLPGLLQNSTPYIIESINININPCEEALELLNASIAENPPATQNSLGVIKPGYSQELDSVIESSKKAREWIANLETEERKRTGIKTLKVGYNKVFGYYIEITHSNTEMVPEEYIRKQTLVNAERYITPEMKEYEALVLNAEERIKEIENQIFRTVCKKLSEYHHKILLTARAIGEIDALLSLSEAAAINGYSKPELTDNTILEIHDGKHPVVEKTLSGERFIANDAIFSQGEFIRIITGPNMSGKSTFLRQVALITLMAQMGSFVPASSAKIGLVDRIFTRIGAQDEIHSGQSTFMVEMIETANILNHASNRSLIILDEVGRGTSTYDGVSIAWSVVEYIHNHPKLRARTLFATHYHELIQLSNFLPGVSNYNIAVTEADGKVIFLHRIVPGGSDRSYGIHVAQLAGLPQPVIQRAWEILEQLESSSGKAIKLETTKAEQMALFPETNPLLEELQSIDLNSISPIEALNKLYEWKKKFVSSD